MPWPELLTNVPQIENGTGFGCYREIIPVEPKKLVKIGLAAMVKP
jgi:hypothetical protein